MKVVIGGTRKDRIPALVCERTVRRFASINVEVIQTWDRNLPGRPCPTGFSFVRFQVPELCGRAGRALYVDSDMLVFADVKELASMNMGGKAVLRAPNQTAVMLIDCAITPWSIDRILSERDAGRPYTDFTQKLWPLSKEQVGLLAPEWNLCDVWFPPGKILHFTSIPTQPWRKRGHPLENLWRSALHEAVGAGTIKEDWLAEDIKLGYVIP